MVNTEINVPIVGSVISEYIVDVADYAPATPGTIPTDWTRLKGLTELTPFVIEKNLEDDSEINGDAWGSQASTSLAWTAEAKIKIPAGSTTADPGYVLVSAAAEGIAGDGLAWVRITKRGATTGRAGLADVSVTADGGRRTDLDIATVSFAGRGALANVDVAPAG